MGGAERAERRRRQQLAAEQAAARAKAKRKPAAEPQRAAPVDRSRVKRVALGVGAAAVVAAVVIAGLIWTDAVKNATEGKVIPAKSVQDIPERRDGAVVVLGEDKAPATIDVYADFLCPACKNFEDTWADEIADHVRSGRLRVRQHMVPMLVEASDPPGYSLDAANAALCAADEEKFAAFHDSLFAAQPGEGKRGYDKGQLTKLGRDLGITGQDFGTCVESGRYDAELRSAFAATKKEIKDFATPTVIGSDGRIDWDKRGWLEDAVS